MGIICSIYLLRENEIDKILKTEDAIEKFLEENFPLLSDNGKYYFENRFDTSNAWNPTFELLNLIIQKHNYFNIIDYKLENLEYVYYNSAIVSSISDKLSNLNHSIINIFLQNKELINKIIETDGYKMDAISFTNVVFEHFVVIKRAFLKASSEGKAVLMNFG